MADNTTFLTLTDQSFQHAVLESARPVLVDFWADWSGPCHMIAPMIENLAVTYRGQLTVGTLNVDHYPEIAHQYGIWSLPTLLFFKDGQVREQIIGARPRHEITATLHALFQADSSGLNTQGGIRCTQRIKEKWGTKHIQR